MKKKIPLLLLVSGVLLIFILGLLWANPAQGKPDPTRLKGDPWQHMKSPKPDDNQNLDFVLLVINSDFYFMCTFQSESVIFRDSDELTNQKSNSSIKARFCE